jgi:hypothetical protein
VRLTLCLGHETTLHFVEERRIDLDRNVHDYLKSCYEVMQQMLIDVLGEPFQEMMQRTVLNRFDTKDSAFDEMIGMGYEGAMDGWTIQFQNSG